MTVATEFFNWSLKAEDPAYDRCSPNLGALRWELSRRFQMVNNGCYSERAVRDGVLPSAHSHGAAIDENYPSRTVAVQQIIPWLINNSRELGVQALHDYFGCRVWRAGRTDGSDGWRAQTPSSATGFGQPWATYFHIETNKTMWGDGTAILTRIGGGTVPPTPVPPSGALVFTRNLKKGDTGPDVGFIQAIIHAPGSATGDKSIVVDGNFGSQTDTAVRNMQKWWGLTADGIVGPQTQAKFMQLANS